MFLSARDNEYNSNKYYIYTRFFKKDKTFLYQFVYVSLTFLTFFFSQNIAFLIFTQTIKSEPT